MLYSTLKNNVQKPRDWIEMAPESVEKNTVYYTWIWPTPTTNIPYITHIYDVSDMVGETIKVTVSSSGGAFARVVFVDIDGNKIGSEINHNVRNETLTFKDYQVVLPAGTDKIYVIGKLNAPIVKRYQTATFSEMALQASKDYRPLADKTILWLGTSIPAGAGYPEKVALDLGANLVNRSIGSSHIRTHKSDGSISTSWEQHHRALGWTVAQIDEIIADLSGTGINAGVTNIPASIDAANQDLMRQNSYENAVVPFLDGTRTQQADIIVIDHGINDYFMDSGTSDADFAQEPSSFTDYSLNRYPSSLNWLVDLIRTYKPTAEILFVSHWHNNGDTNRLVAAQESMATYLGLPFCKLYEANWNVPTTRLIPGTTTSVVNTYIPDGLHPHTDPSHLVATTIASKLKEFILANVSR